MDDLMDSMEAAHDLLWNYKCNDFLMIGLSNELKGVIAFSTEGLTSAELVFMMEMIKAKLLSEGLEANQTRMN